jgi:hypothetical protein
LSWRTEGDRLFSCSFWPASFEGTAYRTSSQRRLLFGPWDGASVPFVFLYNDSTQSCESGRAPLNDHLPDRTGPNDRTNTIKDTRKKTRKALSSDDVGTLLIAIDEFWEHKCADMSYRIAEFEAHPDESVRHMARMALLALSLRDED